jgi:hypothetical protein
MGKVESASSRLRVGAQVKQPKMRRDSQGSLPKSAADVYLYENATEL